MADVNIWSRTLTAAEVELWNRCELEDGGDIVDWKKAKWTRTGLKEVDMDHQEICEEEKVKKLWMISLKKKGFDRTIQLCQALGGEISAPENREDLQDLINAVQSFAKKCGASIFTGYTDKKTEGVWLNGNTGLDNDLAWVRWKDGQPNNAGDGGQDCLTHNVNTEESSDSQCSNKYCPICRVKDKITFHLQGICSNSFIDRFFLLQSTKQLLGYIQTRMIWSARNNRWEIENMISKQIAAFMNESSDFPVGNHLWQFTDESNCTDKDSKLRTLNLHLKVTQPGNFCCDDGTCIDADNVCDGNNHCNSREDEQNCVGLETISPFYDATIPPRLEKFGVQGKMFPKTDINTETEISKITEINEVKSYFIVTFSLNFSWKDQHLIFNFLKQNQAKNVISRQTDNVMSKDRQTIWSPRVLFLEALENAVLSERLSVRKSGSARFIADSDLLHLNETYSGSENFLHRISTHRAKFTCNFGNIKNYPFGSQNCSFDVMIPGAANNLTTLKPTRLSNNGPKSVGQYRIIKWTVESRIVIDNDVGLTFSVEIKRNLWGIILVTYLPTVLMNFINQATNYISSPDKYDMIITVNITCMMVLASIYLSVSTSLPTTAEIKPIEIWLLFSLVYPALLILFNILIQVTNIKK